MATRRVALRALFPLIVLTAVAATAVAQQPKAVSPPSAAKPLTAKSGKAWVPPGTPGSPIDGQLFHAQVLLDAAGF